MLARIDTIFNRYSDWMLLETDGNGLEFFLDMVNLFKRLLNALFFLAVIVAALGIINTMVVNVAERQREIGLLRAVGATQHQIRRAIVLDRWSTGLDGDSDGHRIEPHLFADLSYCGLAQRFSFTRHSDQLENGPTDPVLRSA